MRLEDLWRIPFPEDREILGVLRGGSYRDEYDEHGYRLMGQETQLLCPTYLLDVDLVRLLLPRMAQRSYGLSCPQGPQPMSLALG